MAKYGYFSDDGKEYIIDKPLAPIRHLINFSWNKDIVSGVNQFGTGEGVFNNQTLLYNNQAGRCRMIREGRRYFYLKDEESSTFWNTGHYPVKHEPSKLITVFGTGYSRFIYETEGIKSEATCFVDIDEPVEIWKIKLSNLSGRNRTLKLYPYVEWLLQGYEMKSDYYSYLSSEYHGEINTIVAYNFADERPHERYNGFVASNIKPDGYTGSVREFLGVYGEPTRPENIMSGKCSNKSTSNENLAGSLEIPIKLDNGAEKEVIILIGNTSDIAETKRLVHKVLNPEYIENSFKQLIKEKDSIISQTIIHTPDEKINRMVNIWSKVQLQLCAEFGRDGVRGFRDTLQDAWGILSFNSELGKEKILEALRYQMKEGWALRGWMPVTKKHYSDSTTWIIPAVTDYIKYTGDNSILEEVVPYFDNGEGTVLEHLLQALRYLNKDKGEHGLCLAHMGDWNDSLNWMGQDGRGESVMTSMAHYRSLVLFQELSLVVLENFTLAKEMEEAAEVIKNSVETNAWDGEWYLTGFSDYGNKVGSKENEQGSIFAVPQAWALISGIASSERAEKCMNNVAKMLEAETGCVMCRPAFKKRDVNVGRLSIMIPGMYENASTYCHGTAFVIAAALLAGKPDYALELYRKVIPDSNYHSSDISGVEPYAFTNQYLGPDNKRAGVSVSGWITGTAGWMYRNMINLMLGFQPGYNGIYIRPCISDEWPEVSIQTTLRGTRYNITIKNCKYGNIGITVNGEKINGNFIPYGKDTAVEIIVLL